MKEQVRQQLKDAGYSDKQINKGFEYAEEKGYSDANELGSLAMTRILYTDSQIEKGDYFEFELYEEDEVKSESYTAEEIANYISEWADIESPGTRDDISVWATSEGLTHTRGSMEYRDDEHEHLVTISLYNEHAPYSLEDVIEIVEYSRHKDD